MNKLRFELGFLFGLATAIITALFIENSFFAFILICLGFIFGVIISDIKLIFYKKKVEEIMQ